MKSCPNFYPDYNGRPVPQVSRIPDDGRGFIVDPAERRHQAVMQALNALIAVISKPLRRVSPNRVFHGVPR